MQSALCNWRIICIFRGSASAIFERSLPLPPLLARAHGLWTEGEQWHGVSMWDGVRIIRFVPTAPTVVIPRARSQGLE